MYDVIVCGAGVNGLNTANYLVERNKSVLVIEQFPLPHVRGSSHGASRIIRHSYDKAHYAEMMPECFERWNRLGEQTDTNLFTDCGTITLGPRPYIADVEANLQTNKIPHETLHDPLEVQEKFPGFSSGDLSCVHEPSGGILMADRCLLALQQSIKAGGGKINDGEKVEKIEEINSGEDCDDGYVRITTNRSIYSAKKVVLTCGAWINKVIKPFGVEYPLKPMRINVLYWKAKNPNLYSVNNFPGVLIENHPLHFYSLPIMEYPGHMKVCFHYGVKIDPDQPAKLGKTGDVIRARQLEYLLDCVKTHYPDLELQPGVQENCIYTNTPDSDLILECLPGHPRIVVGAGFSGHGFKLGPATGHILGDLAIDRQPPYPLEPFSSSRFKNTSRM